MKDVPSFLRDGDPLVDDPGLSVAEVQTMRQRILRSARAEDPRRIRVRRPIVFGAAIAVLIALGLVSDRQTPIPPDAIATRQATATPASVSSPSPQYRQLQFSTPGGTRLIWVFNSEFQLKEVRP